VTKYEFRFASSEEDMAGVRRLNHLAFAEELAQHERTPDGLLRDKFEEKSRYIVAACLIPQGGMSQIIGMVAIHDQPPFSIEKRLADPAAFHSLGARFLEVRLLAIEPAHRTRLVVGGLYTRVMEAALDGEYDALLISGVSTQAPMYRRMGFRELGPAVRDGLADFFPMAMRLSEVPPQIKEEYERFRARAAPPP
jgi:hypothetical protein